MNTLSRHHIHYQVFQGLLLLGFLFHQTEDWRNRTYAILSVMGIIGFALLPKLRDYIFTSIMILGIVRYLSIFPNLANHSNFNLVIYLVLLPIQYQIMRGRQPDFQSLLHCMRWLIFILYFFTFFHKLNWDFLDPVSSCAGRKLEDYYDMIPLHWTNVRYAFYHYTPALGLIVEGVIPVFIFAGATRYFAILFIIILHFTLAPMGFTDFSSLAMSFGWLFVDPNRLKIEKLEFHFKVLALTSVLLSLVIGIFRFPDQVQALEIPEGLAFAGIYAPFCLYYFLGSVSRENLPLPKFNWQKAVVLFLFFFGMNSYLGLRTAGNFSMFSNLRTEGELSNHMLLGSNPFKVFGMQEDVVEILDVSKSAAGFYKRMPRKGQKIPKIEFSRLLSKYREYRWRGVKLKIRYEGKEYSTKNAGFDRDFFEESPWILVKLFKFRFIQPDRPQFCHW